MAVEDDLLASAGDLMTAHDEIARLRAEIERLEAAVREALEYLESDALVTWQQRSGNAAYVLNAVLTAGDE